MSERMPYVIVPVAVGNVVYSDNNIIRMTSFRNVVFAISSVSDVAEALPFTIWIFYAKKQRPYYVLGVFFGLLFAVKLYTLITAELKHNNMPAYHLLALIEILSVYCFYCQVFYQR